MSDVFVEGELYTKEEIENAGLTTVRYTLSGFSLFKRGNEMFLFGDNEGCFTLLFKNEMKKVKE